VPVLVVLARIFSGRAGAALPPDPGGSQSIEKLAAALFTTYLFPFEVISVLLLAAMVGAVVLAMRKF
jgi:NADH-quinone oxidoreductase subunit J